MAKRLGLTWRAVIIGILASAFLGHWSQYAELIIHGTQLSFTFPPIGGFFVFLCIYLFFNIILRAAHRGLSLTRAELVFIFIMTVMASGIASQDLAQKIPPMIAGPFYYASPENGWEELFVRYIPDWMSPRDARVVKGLFEASAFPVPWREWLVPLLAWGALSLGGYALMVCLMALFRRQWVERERLLFPLVVLPLQVMEEAPRRRLLNDFLRNPFMWAGLTLAFGVHFYNGLHGYYPQLPEIEVCKLGGKPVPTYTWGRPWEAIGTIRFAAMPMIIGLSFLLTREMAFSLWVCYWLARLEAMLGSALGISGLTTAAGGDSFSFPGQQTAAAYLALAAASIWIARRPLAQVVTAGLTLQKHPDEDREPLSYRAAVWGGIVCLVFMTAWCSHAGMPVVTAVALWLIVFGYMLAMTRMLAEGGMPWLDHPTWGAQDVLRAVIPYRSMSVQQWTAVAAVIPYCYHLRVNPMPRIMQSLKISDESGTSNRHVTWSLLIATIIAIPVGLYALISAGYVYGGVAINPARFVSMARYSGIFMERVTNSALKHTDWISLGIMGYSATKLFTLSYLRLRYLWWPLHPVAYAMSFNVYVVREWLSVLIGWLAQATIMRYGGHRAVQRYRPFFLGLILGAMLVCGVWLIIDGITGLRDHKILY